jgi:hypothetical protein
MKNQSKVLTVIGLLFFLAGGISWCLFSLVVGGYEHLAVPVAAILAAVGGFVLILNAVINPESVKIPEVKVNVPDVKINLPSHINGYRGTHTETNAKVPGVINVNEWFIVNLFQKDSKPLTRRQRVRGTLCCLLWLATVAVYLPVSFYMDNFEISWIAFFGAAVVHVIIYGLLSIGEQKTEQGEI